jgi:DNA-binding response OmpR family regulator
VATILLVDNEKILRTLMRVALEKESHQVLEAASSGRALTLARQHSSGIDLLIADLALSKKNGLELADALAAKHAHMRCLFLSRFPHSEDLIETARLHGRTVVREPFDIRVLIEQVSWTLHPGDRDRKPARVEERGALKRQVRRKG